MTNIHTIKIQKALETAAYLHRNQVRKGDPPLPYIIHLVSTMLIVLPYTSDEDVICAALLHDVLEDIDKKVYSDQDMINTFGPKVHEIVSGVTENTRITNWKARKDAYIEHLQRASKETLMVSVADKIHNLTDLIAFHKQVGSRMWEKFEFSAQDNIWYHESVLKIVSGKLPAGLCNEYNSLIQEAKSEYQI